MCDDGLASPGAYKAYSAYLMSEGRQFPQMSALEHLLPRWGIYCPETYLYLTYHTLGLTIVPSGLTIVPFGLINTPRGSGLGSITISITPTPYW